MKQSLSLQELAAEIQYIDTHKQDFIEPAHLVNYTVNKGGAEYESRFGSGGMTNHAFSQVSADLGIPSSYRNKLMQSGNFDLLADNINTLNQQSIKNRTFRLVDSDMRASLSDSYSMDYDDPTIFKAILPVLHDMGDDIVVQSAGLTETNMYLKVTSKKLMGEVKVGDVVNGGIMFRNSSVGMGFYQEQEFINRLVCLNGMVKANNVSSFKKMHKGAKQGLGEVRSDTTYAIQQAIALQIRDSIRASLNPVHFQKTLEDMKETTTRKISGKVDEAVKELGKIVGYTQSEGDDIFKHLIEGGDLSQYGLLNAVTKYAQDDDISYDRATQLEVIGGKVLSLNAKQWRNVSEAA